MASGSSTNAVRPSCHGRFSRYEIRPSSVHARRSCAKEGRAPYKLVAIKVTADRVTLDDNGEKVEIVLGAVGMLTMPGEASRAAHVEGADSAGKRRAMMLMLGMMLGAGGSSKTPVDNAP